MPKAKKGATPNPFEKPKLGLPDEIDSLRETCRNMQEGNQKLCQSVDVYRNTLETIVTAEWDSQTNSPVSPTVLRGMAIEALDTVSRMTGQNWRKHKIKGSYAGDRNLQTLEA